MGIIARNNVRSKAICKTRAIALVITKIRSRDLEPKSKPEINPNPEPNI